MDWFDGFALIVAVLALAFVRYVQKNVSAEED